MQEMFLRKIPEDMRPWECNVNGVKYVYPAGTEQNVPAEVAALIDAYWEKQEVDYPETGISFNDLRDRPFGESTEVLFDQTVELEGGDAMLSTPLGLFEGQTYKVTFDGTTYDCIAEMFSTDGTTKLGVYIGSLEQSEYPFTIVEFVPEMAEQVGGLVSISADLEDASVNTSATVKIEKSVIHTIDPKFLPGGGSGGKVTLYAKLPYLNKSSDLGESTRPSKAEVFEYVKNGGFVIAEPHGGTYYFPVVVSTGGENQEYAIVDCYDSLFYSKEYVSGGPGE